MGEGNGGEGNGGEGNGDEGNGDEGKKRPNKQVIPLGRRSVVQSPVIHVVSCSSQKQTKVPHSLPGLLAGMVVAQYDALSTTWYLWYLDFLKYTRSHGCPRCLGTGSSC